MRKFYSLTEGQQAIHEMVRAMRDMTGKLPIFPGIFAFSFAVAIAPAQADEAHNEKVKLFGEVSAFVSLAEQTCAAMKVYRPALYALADKFGLTEMDKDAMSAAVMAALANSRKSLDAVGDKQWCTTTWRNFGPDGSIVPGLLMIEP